MTRKARGRRVNIYWNKYSRMDDIEKKLKAHGIECSVSEKAVLGLLTAMIGEAKETPYGVIDSPATQGWLDKAYKTLENKFPVSWLMEGDMYGRVLIALIIEALPVLWMSRLNDRKRDDITLGLRISKDWEGR